MDKEVKNALTRNIKNLANDYTYRTDIDTARVYMRHKVTFDYDKDIVFVDGKRYKIIRQYAIRKTDGFYKTTSIKFKEL